MASNGFKKLMLGMEELGEMLNQGDEYFDTLYSSISKDELDEYRNGYIAEDIDEAVLTETNESGEDEIDANCEKCGAIIKVPADFFDEVDDEGNLVDKKVICASCREKNESLNEGNSVSGKIPPALDSFLQDIAQMYETIDYGDIMDHDYTEDDIRKLNNLRRRFITWSQYDEDDDEVKAKFNEIANKVAEILKRVDESMNEGRNDPYFTPYGYRAAAKVLNRTAPQYYWHLKEIEMDRGDGVKLANYALKKGLPVMLDKNSDPDYPEFYLKDGSSEYHWGDYFYTYGFTNPDATDLVPYEGNLDILNTAKDDNKMTEDMSIRAKLKALYPELDFSDDKNEALPLATLATSAIGSFIGKKLAEEIDDDMNPDIEEAINEAANNKITLEVMFEEYERYEQGNVRRAKVSGKDILSALKKMLDNMRLYITSDDIEEKNLSAEEVIEEIESTNGDGCDFIFYIKNLTTGEMLLNNDYEDEEDWDDEEDLDDNTDFDIDESAEYNLMETLYKGADFDAHDDEALEESSDCEDDECWENDCISEEFDDDM